MTDNSQLIHAPVLNWSKTPLAKYAGHYVKIIDNLFSAEECAELIKLAESGAEWQQAAIHYGIKEENKYVDTNYRNGERILRFDHATAEKLYQKVLPYVQELVEIEKGSPWEGVVGRKGFIVGKWKMIGFNELLRFLKYEKGGFFRPHCDAQVELPDGRKSRVTVQIYLGEDGLEGGATRILDVDIKYVDVLPKKGRVLIFQQPRIYHSGEEVTKGVKYTLRTDILFRQTVDEHE